MWEKTKFIFIKITLTYDIFSGFPKIPCECLKSFYVHPRVSILKTVLGTFTSILILGLRSSGTAAHHLELWRPTSNGKYSSLAIDDAEMGNAEATAAHITISMIFAYHSISFLRGLCPYDLYELFLNHFQCIFAYPPRC